MFFLQWSLKNVTGYDTHQLETTQIKIQILVSQIIGDYPDQVAQFREGKEKVLGFFVGQVMKATNGKANPKQVNEILRRELNVQPLSL